VILGKTGQTVTFADKAVVDNAITAYNALSPDAKSLLTAEKTKLDNMKARIDTLGRGSVTLIYPQNVAAGELAGGPIVIFKGRTDGTEVHTVAMAGSFDTCRWLVDGNARGDGPAFTLNAGDYTQGIHQISLELTLDGAVYSKSGSFTVQ
jgi:hypothetical protein